MPDYLPSVDSITVVNSPIFTLWYFVSEQRDDKRIFDTN